MLKIIILLLSFNVYCQNATLLDEGEKAPYNGVLVTEDTFNDLVRSDKKALVLTDLRLVDKDIMDYQKVQIKELNSQLTRKELGSTLQSILMFSLGVITTITIVNNVPR
jgi:hypothetical protein